MTLLHVWRKTEYGYGLISDKEVYRLQNTIIELDTTLQGREARSLARFVIPRCPSTLSVTCPHVSLRTTDLVPNSCWGTVDYPYVAFLKHFAQKVPPKWLQNGTPKLPTVSLNLTFWDVFLKTSKIIISNCQWVSACVLGSYTLHKNQLLSYPTN